MKRKRKKCKEKNMVERDQENCMSMKDTLRRKNENEGVYDKIRSKQKKSYTKTMVRKGMIKERIK